MHRIDHDIDPAGDIRLYGDVTETGRAMLIVSVIFRIIVATFCQYYALFYNLRVRIVALYTLLHIRPAVPKLSLCISVDSSDVVSTDKIRTMTQGALRKAPFCGKVNGSI